MRPLQLEMDWTRRLLKPGAKVEALLGEAKHLSPARLEGLLQRSRTIVSVRRHTTAGLFPELSALGTAAPPRLSDLRGELNWLVALARNNIEQLQEVFDLKEKFSRYILKHDLPQARNVLDALTRNHGWSLWSIEAALLVGNLHSTTNGERRLAEIIEEATSPAVKIFAASANLRVQPNVSAPHFDRDITHFITNTLRSDPDDIDTDFEFAIRALLHPSSISDWPSPQATAYALHYHNHFSILDRYALLLTTLRGLLASRSPSSPEYDLAARYARRLASTEACSQTRQLGLYLTPRTIRPNATQNRLIFAADIYTRGDYRETLSTCAKYLNELPAAVEFSELYARAASFLPGPDENQQLNVGQVAEDVTRNTVAVVRRAPECAAATSRLLSLSYQYNCTDLGPRLLTFTLTHFFPTHLLASPRYRFFVASAPSPRSADAFQPHPAQEYLARLLEIYPDSISVRLFQHLTTDASPEHLEQLSPRLPQDRIDKYQALWLEREKLYSRAVSLYQRILKTASPRSPSWLDAMLGLLRGLQATGEFTTATISAADCYIENPQALPVTYVANIVAHPPQANDSPDAHISHAVLVYALQKSQRPTLDATELYPTIESALCAVNKSRPSQLTDGTPVPLRKLVLFLHSICLPEVLDWSIEYANSHDLESERIEICRLLQRLDKDNLDMYAGEIDRRTKAAAIQDVVQTATLSKVHVDTDGIRRTLGPELKETFYTYRQHARIEQDILLAVERALRSRDGPESQLVILTEQHLASFLRRGPATFALLFDIIKHRFIASDEHGLDSYLSVRIRHGTFAGHLRNTFERRQLVTRRVSSAGDYIPNETWGPIAPLEAHDEIQRLLAEFSRGVDEAIDEAKNDWLQIRSADHPLGMFDFSYSDDQLMELHDVFNKLDDPDAFITAAFDELWARTKLGLARIREAIGTRLSSRLMSALDCLDSGVRTLNCPGYRDLAREIAMSRTEIQNELAVVATWFDVRDLGALADYELSVAVDAAVTIVRRIHNEHFRPSITNSCPTTLRGSTLPHILDICHILFENIVRHSGQNMPEATVRLEAADARLSITAGNPLPAWANEDELQLKAAKLEEYASAIHAEGVKTEGGSGYRKLGKILRHDLSCTDARVTVSVAQRFFTVTVDVGLPPLASSPS